jgi:hypothetical protein
MGSQTDQTHLATFSTILFSLLGVQNISELANVIFLGASTISCAISILVGIKQLNKKK